jgi:hypothetical protein
VYQLVLADDPVAVAHQKDEKIEYLRFERDQPAPAAEFAAVRIEYMIAKPEDHTRSPGPSEPTALRKRHAHLKVK